MIVTGFDGFWFGELDMDGELEEGGPGNWAVAKTVVNRGSGNPIIATATPQPRSIDVTFIYSGPDEDLWETFDELFGKLRPDDYGKKRKLYATRNDLTEVWRYATIAKIAPPGEEINTTIVSFVSEDARWFKTESVTQVMGGISSDIGTHQIHPGVNVSAMALPNTGHATVHPVITIPAGTILAGSPGGWERRRSFTVTNNLNRTVHNHVAMIELGDTAALTPLSAMVNGDDLRIIGPTGEEVPRNLVAWDTALTFAYFYIASIEPGEVQDYSVIYMNAAASSPLTLTYPYAPAFLTDWYQSSASFAADDSAELWIEITGDIFSGRDNKFKDGVLYFQTGLNAGTGKKILSHTYNTPTGGRTRITFTSAFANDIATTDDFLVIASRNGVWMYDVESDESRGSDAARGRWYSSSGESPPDIIDFTVPGAWQRYLYYDGRDKKGQPRYSRITHGGDLDTYTVLDAQRSWEQGARVEEEGEYDGVSLSLPFPITGFDWTGHLTNPTGFAKGFIGQRAAGGNDWLELASNSTVYATATAWAPTTTIVGTPLQLYQGLIPALGDEVDQSWRRDRGSSTASTTTTLTDSTKAWQTNQWVGAKLFMTGGRRSGQVFTVLSNTATVITITTTLTTAFKVDQPYEVINPPVLARLRDDDRCTVTFDDSGLAISALGAQTNVIDMSARFWIGGGPQSSSALEGHRRSSLEVGKDADLFVFQAHADEYIVFDSDRRAATLFDDTDAVIERYTDPRVRCRYTDEDGNEVQSANGIPLPPGVNVLVNPSAAANVNNWTKTNSGTITSAITRDVSYFVDLDGGVSSFKLAVSASTGPAYTEMVANDRIPINPGELAAFAAYVFTESATIKPLLGIRFYTAAGSTVSTDLQVSTPTYATGIFYAEGHAAEAPATAASWAPVIRANIASGSPTGAVFFDVVRAGAPILFLQSDHKIFAELEVTYTEAYLQ